MLIFVLQHFSRFRVNLSVIFADNLEITHYQPFYLGYFHVKHFHALVLLSVVNDICKSRDVIVTLPTNRKRN